MEFLFNLDEQCGTILKLNLNADGDVFLLLKPTLKLVDTRLLVLLRAEKLLDLGQVAVDGEVFPGQLFDDFILALNVLAETVVLLFDSSLFFENLDELILNDLLLLDHFNTCGFDLLTHLLVVLATELQLFLEFNQVAGAGLDSSNMLLLRLQLSSQSLHLGVISLHLTLKELLL